MPNTELAAEFVMTNIYLKKRKITITVDRAWVYLNYVNKNIFI